MKKLWTLAQALGDEATKFLCEMHKKHQVEMPIQGSWPCKNVAFRELKKRSQLLVLHDLMRQHDLRKAEQDAKIAAWEKAKKEADDTGESAPPEPATGKLMSHNGMSPVIFGCLFLELMHVPFISLCEPVI